MSWLAELRTTALVGTARHPAPSQPGALGVRPPEDLTNEASLLDQAALADVASRAARQPGGMEVLPRIRPRRTPRRRFPTRPPGCLISCSTSLPSGRSSGTSS